MINGEDKDNQTSNSIEQDKAHSSQIESPTSIDPAITNLDNDNVITIVNHRNTLRTFIERSPLGLQFALIVLFYMAQAYPSRDNKTKQPDKSTRNVSLSSFSFTSKEFLGTYSQLASDMGLTKYLVRHMAFAEFILTLEYLALIREDELTAKYQFGIDFEDLRWLASMALQQIAGGYGISSPEIFYTSSGWPSLSIGNAQPGKNANPPTRANTDRTVNLIKDLSQSIFSLEELEIRPGDGTNISYDDFVRPRSRDYGLHRPYFPHRVPPTTYRFRKPNDGEWKRIIKEFFDGQTCITCNSEVLPDYFEIWIGEALEDTATLPEKSDQTMTEILANIDSLSAKGSSDADATATTHQIIDSDKNITDRELLTYSYGIIPMDGRDAFIAFAKPKQLCPKCGCDPTKSVSLMPNY